MNEETNDQIAKVMLLTGTDEQKQEALTYAGIPAPNTYASLAAEMTNAGADGWAYRLKQLELEHLAVLNRVPIKTYKKCTNCPPIGHSDAECGFPDCVGGWEAACKRQNDICSIALNALEALIALPEDREDECSYTARQALQQINDIIDK